MKLKRKHRFAAEVSTSSLNDIMFFLLLFFLIISTVANPNVIKLMLPKANSTQTITKQPLSLSVRALNGQKEYYLENKIIAPENIETELKTRLNGVEDPTVVLRLEKDLMIQDLVDVMQIGARLNIKMVMATEKN